MESVIALSDLIAGKVSLSYDTKTQNYENRGEKHCSHIQSEPFFYKL